MVLCCACVIIIYINLYSIVIAHQKPSSYYKPFPVLHFQFNIILKQQIVFLLSILLLACSTHPPSPTVNWHCWTHRACVIFLHMEWPIQLIPRQAASHPASQWGRQPGRKHSSGEGHAVSANRWRAHLVAFDCASLSANSVALICLFVQIKS